MSVAACHSAVIDANAAADLPIQPDLAEAISVSLLVKADVTAAAISPTSTPDR